MTGLKQTILNDQPVSFWSFDFDRNLINNDQIIDEIGNQNPILCQNDPLGVNYQLEQQSLNEIEHADQFAISIAKNQKIGNNWLNQYLEAPHTPSYEFPTLGQFSIEFLYYKQFADDIRNSGEIGQSRVIETPILSKGNVISVIVSDVVFGNDYLEVNFMGRRIRVDHNEYPIFNHTNHVIITYNVDQIDVNEYTSTLQLWINGRMWGEDVRNHIDLIPITSTTASWLFAGNGGSNPNVDFATEELRLDQIAIYQYALTSQQIGNHYRKTKQYDAMILDDQPEYYWRFDEFDIPTEDTITARKGTITGKYYGGVGRYNSGPDEIVTAHAPFFNSGGSGFISNIPSGRFSPILDLNNSFTLEFWFRSGDGKRGMILDSTEESPPRWDGLRVYLNSRNGGHDLGSIQVYHNNQVFMNSLEFDGNGDRYTFNDDAWHHVAIRYNTSTTNFSLLIDGNEHSSILTQINTIQSPGQITIMNSRPGDAPLQGYFCELAFYEYELQNEQIYNRVKFSTRYVISGFTLLQGVPIQAIVRFYDSITGELISEVVSDSNTGEYTFYPLNNNLLDVLSKIPDSNNTRYRVHGPVKPAEFNDSHLQ